MSKIKMINGSTIKFSGTSNDFYKGVGDDMQEVYPPDYQAFLDSQEPTIDDREKALLAVVMSINETVKGAPF